MRNKLVKEEEADILYFELSYMLIKGEDVLKSSSIVIELGTMITVQALLEQSLFYLLGWQVLGTPQILESDIGENSFKDEKGNLNPFKRNN